jgi:hypothetical protein
MRSKKLSQKDKQNDGFSKIRTCDCQKAAFDAKISSIVDQCYETFYGRK